MSNMPAISRSRTTLASMVILTIFRAPVSNGSDAVARSLPKQSSIDATPRVLLKDVVVVHDDDPKEALRLSIDAFVERAKFLGGAPRRVVAAKELKPTDAAGAHLLLVGTPAANARLGESVSDQLEAAFGKEPAWVQEQGYLIELSADKANSASIEIVAGSLGTMGSVYALADLEMRLASVDGEAVLVLDDMAALDDSRQSQNLATDRPAVNGNATIALRIEKPALPERGEYLNFSGTPDRYVLPIGWEKEEWEEHIDLCVKARLTFVSVYIWSSQILAAAENPEQDAQLKQMHENILHGLRYAHQRGLKFKYLFTPSTVPPQAYQKGPAEYRAPQTHYDWPTYKLLNPGAVAAIKEIYKPQIEMFREADAFHIFFFDPGGDFSDEFLANWGQNLANHIIDFQQLVHAVAPHGQIEFNLWNADLFAEAHKPFAEDLLRFLHAHYGAKTKDMGVFCAPKYAPLAKELGFQTERFLFDTNHERAYVFFTPQFPRIYDDTRALYPLYDSAFCHRVEVGSKFPNTFISACWFWNPELSIGEILRRYGLWAVGPDATDDLADAIMTLDRITFDPGNLVFARELTEQTKRAEAKTAPHVREHMEWLFTSLYGTAAVADLAAAKTSEERQAHEQRLYGLLKASRMFRPSLEKWIEPSGQAPKWAKLISVGNRFSGF